MLVEICSKGGTGQLREHVVTFIPGGVFNPEV